MGTRTSDVSVSAHTLPRSTSTTSCLSARAPEPTAAGPRGVLEAPVQLPASSAPSPGLHIIRPDTEQPHPSSSHTPELTARPAQGFRHLAPLEPPGTGILPTVGQSGGWALSGCNAGQTGGGAAGGTRPWGRTVCWPGASAVRRLEGRRLSTAGERRRDRLLSSSLSNREAVCLCGRGLPSRTLNTDPKSPLPCDPIQRQLSQQAKR